MIYLPHWKTAQDRVQAGLATPLDEFIYNWEPAGLGDTAQFRRGLENLVECVQNGGCRGEVAADEQNWGAPQLDLDLEPE